MAPRWQDHFTRDAKAAGYPARSVFKLDEVQRRTQVIRRGMRAIDLGCCPGSWSIFLVEQGVSRLVGVDLTPPPSYPGTFFQGDLLTLDPAVLVEALGARADLVVSDMAPSTMGHSFTDHVRQVELARGALRVARFALRPGGHFVVKVFEGQEAGDFVAEVKLSFQEVRRIRPEATRKASVEFFVVGKGFRDSPTLPADPP